MRKLFKVQDLLLFCTTFFLMNTCNAYSEQIVSIKTFSNNYLSATDGGGVSSNEALHTDQATIGDFEKFTCISVGPDQMAFLTPNGTNYLTAVNGGEKGNASSAITTTATGVSGFERFTLVWLDEGKCALRTKNGNYVTAVNGGGFGEEANVDVFHTDASAIKGWEVFTVKKLGCKH